MSRSPDMRSVGLFSAPAASDVDTLSLHDALPIYHPDESLAPVPVARGPIKGPQFDGRRFAAFFPIDRAKGPQLSHPTRSEEHTSELQSQFHLVCRLLLEKKKISSLSAQCSSIYAG